MLDDMPDWMVSPDHGPALGFFFAQSIHPQVSRSILKAGPRKGIVYL